MRRIILDNVFCAGRAQSGARAVNGKRGLIWLSRSCRIGAGMALLGAAMLCGQPVCRADQPVWATGHVVDASNRPLVGALVAVYDDNNKVIDYARTDETGDYALAVPRNALHLQEHHAKGFFAEVFGGVTRVVGGTVGFVANPLRAGVKAVTSSQIAAFADPLTKGGLAVGGAVVDQALFAASPHPRRPSEQELRKLPGALLIKVIAPDNSDMVGITRVYWIQKETYKTRGRETHALAAWLDPVQLMNLSSDKPSNVQSTYLNFTSARLEPSLAQRGQTVRISAALTTPAEPTVHVLVVARDNRTGESWELQPAGNGRFETQFVVDKRFATDDHPISILAYPASELKPGRRPDVEKAIAGADLWDTKKPFLYEPLLVVSRNRAEVTLTVLGPGKRRRD